MSTVTVPAVTAADLRNHALKGRDLLGQLLAWAARADVLDGRYQTIVGGLDPNGDISDGCGHGQMMDIFGVLEDLAKTFNYGHGDRTGTLAELEDRVPRSRQKTRSDHGSEATRAPNRRARSRRH